MPSLPVACTLSSSWNNTAWFGGDLAYLSRVEIAQEIVRRSDLAVRRRRLSASGDAAQVLIHTMCAVAGVFRWALLEICNDDGTVDEEEAAEMWEAIQKAATVLRAYVHHEEPAVCNAAVMLVQVLFSSFSFLPAWRQLIQKIHAPHDAPALRCSHST